MSTVMTDTTSKPDALARVSRLTMDEYEGSSRDPKQITKRIRQAMEYANYIGITQCPNLPEACEVMFSAVLVDTELENKEVYKLPGGQLGLHKVVLNKIKEARGVVWEPSASGRLDDGSNPHYCHYKAYGKVRKIDGSWSTIEGDDAIDLREGSALCDEIRELKIDSYLDKLEKEAKGTITKDDRERTLAAAIKAANADIRKKRIKILRLAQTSAQNAAIRTLGIKTSYLPEELEKPFVISSLMFTGRSDNPVIAEKMADRIADSFLGARQQLFGETSPAPVAQQQHHAGAPPPPLPHRDEETFIEGDLGEDDAELTEAAGRVAANETPDNNHVAGATVDQTTDAPAIDPPKNDFEIKFGNDKGKKVSEVSLSRLSSLESFLRSSVESDDPDRVKYRSQNQKQLNIVMEWIEYRRATGGTAKKVPHLF